MKKFWSYISGNSYSIGCTGQTVYVYDKDGQELAKFKDIKYGYNAVFSPAEDLFVIKSTAGQLAAYTLEPLQLMKRFRFSRVDGSQDDGYCFSADGKIFYNVERHGESYLSAISAYETGSFTRVKMYFADDDNIRPSHIECDAKGQLFVLGVFIEDGYYFIAKLGADGLEDVRCISEEEHDFYRDFKHLELTGFTQKAKEWSGFRFRNIDTTGMENRRLPLSELWKSKG